MGNANSLHRAIVDGKTESAKKLVQRGAPVDQRANGSTPLHVSRPVPL